MLFRSPTFNLAGQSNGLYCADHKLEGMVNVVSKHCCSPLCTIQVTNKYSGYCLRCFVQYCPDVPVARNYKTKETAVVHFIQERFSHIDWTWDKRIVDGCSKRRPDLIADMGSHVLIIEVDENEHIDYDTTCENKRIAQLWQDVGYRSLVMLRFNPDSYICADGTKVTSCWGTDGRGMAVVKKSQTHAWKARLAALAKRIAYWTDAATDKSITVEQLFFDDKQGQQ